MCHSYIESFIIEGVPKPKQKSPLLEKSEFSRWSPDEIFSILFSISSIYSLEARKTKDSMVAFFRLKTLLKTLCLVCPECGKHTKINSSQKIVLSDLMFLDVNKILTMDSYLQKLRT